MKEWIYGGHHKLYPIEPGQVWGCDGHRLGCLDWVRCDPGPIIGEHVSMAYVDPPWNTGNINSFRTKAQADGKDQFEPFFDRLIELLRRWSPDVNYVEMGSQNLGWCQKLILANGGVVDKVWDIVYYRRLRCHLMRFGWTEARQMHDADLFGFDDADTPSMAIAAEAKVRDVRTVLDLCTGQGETLRACLMHGVKFVGTELNKHRLADAIHDMVEAGLNPQRLEGPWET